jgi:hypothetical protein
MAPTKQGRDFRRWHRTDLSVCPFYGRYWGQSGRDSGIAESTRLTQLGHLRQGRGLLRPAQHLNATRGASASPLSLMLSAMRVKSPFSQSALFGFIGPSVCGRPPMSQYRRKRLRYARDEEIAVGNNRGKFRPRHLKVAT